MKTQKITIVKHPDAKRAKRWQVKYRDGHSVRRSRFFATQAEAKTFAEARETEMLNFGLNALNLPDTARREAQQSLELLHPFGKSILDAVGFYVAHLKRTTESCLIEDLVERFLWDKQANQVSATHLYDLQNRLRRFAAAFPGKIASAFETEEIADWLRALPVATQTRLNYRRILHNLFSFGVRRKLVAPNPVTHTPLIRVPDKEVVIYTPNEIDRLLANADPLIIPYIVLGAFAGIRRAELIRLRWEDIQIQTGHIRIGANIAKTQSKRLIPFSENLLEWLMPQIRAEGQIVTNEWKVRMLIKKACVQSKVAWKKNALRHSYATYRLAQTQDIGKTSMEMGNSPGVIFKHYRELVTKEQALAYWSIRPETESKIIPMTEAAA